MLLAAIGLLAAWSVGGTGLSAHENSPPAQFTDEEYLANGIDPALPDPADPANPHNRPPLPGFDPSKFVDPLDGVDDGGRATLQSDGTIEVNELTGGYNHSGKAIFYTVLSKFNEGSFTDDAAGDNARDIADFFVAYIFPKASGPQFVPMFPNRRQDNLFDTRHGYFSNNPLGLWILVFVSYTDKAFETEEGLDALFELADENGLNLDGTPIIKTVGDLEDLEEDGFVQFRTRDLDGSQGFPWVI